VRPRLAPAGAATLPRTGVFERIRALPDKRVVDRLLRGRLCIWVIGVLLGGIVAMQVSLLKLNAGISRAVVTASTLERKNSDLEASIAKATSGDRIDRAAADDGMIDPPAGETRFLRSRGSVDAALAVKRMKPPSEAAMAIMQNFGRVPGALNTSALAGAGATGATVGTAQTQTSSTATTTGTTATATTSGVTATATATATPTPAATPVPTPVPTAAPGTGAATAPQG
jgi:hypothetical protein